MIQSNGYDELLLNLIPKLGEFESKSGVEGTAYFVDDNFVIKRIRTSTEKGLGSELLNNFKCYFEEIKMFAEKGYAVPKIYSWASFPNFSGYEDCFTFYVLEEKIPGEILFEQRLHKIQSRCLDICGESEFEMAMIDKQGLLYNEIVERYFKLFIEWNERLESISDSELERLIMSEYEMAVTQKHSFVDVHPENVLFDVGKLTIIDNSFNPEPENLSTEGAKQMLLEDMVNLFRDNVTVSELAARKVFENNSKIQSLHQKNQKIAGEAIHKFVKKANYLVSPSFYQMFAFNDVVYFLKKMLNKDKADAIINDFQMS